MLAYFPSGGSLHSRWLPGWGETAAGQVSPARRLVGENGSPPTHSLQVSIHDVPTSNSPRLPRALESTIISHEAT